MAKRQLNKNLVAFLTATGIVLAVVVVAIAAISAARKDPAVIAEKALQYEKDGDLERAMRTYQRAYNTSEAAKYLIDAARCAHQLGELNQMFSLLNFAHAQAPNDPDVLAAVLQRYWEIRGVNINQWPYVLERAESLLSLEPANPLALASKADALERLQDQDPSYAAAAEATLRRAVEIDATDPYVAIVRAERRRLRAVREAREALQSEGRDAAEAIEAEARAARVEWLTPAVEAHPDDSTLRTVLAQALLDGEDFEACAKVLEDGIARAPDDPDLHFALAAMKRQLVQQIGETASVEDVRAHVDEGLAHVNKAIELEPALFAAYTLRADLQELGWRKDGSWKADPGKHEKLILQSFEAALRDTVGLHSIRATLGGRARLEMITRAFNRALTYHTRSADEASKSQALAYLRLFHQEALTQYAQYAVVSLMEGFIALIDQDDRLAVKAFSDAEERASRPGALQEHGQSAREELVKLYRKLGEHGLALKYAEKAIEAYRRDSRLPPRGLVINEAELLESVDRLQDALDLLEGAKSAYPDDPVMATVRARILTRLGRADEATRLLRHTETDNLPLLVEKARIAAFSEDYETATDLLHRALESAPEHLPAIRLLMQILLATERPDEARQLIQERLAATTNEQLRRALRAYEVMLLTVDRQERNQKLLELIAEVPDEFDRAAEYFNFWVDEGDRERALSYLDQMESLRPQDARVLELQFNMALRVEDCERAARYMTTLADQNVDQAGGALFRGRYELRCGDVEKALSSFRAAERVFPSDSTVKILTAQALLLVQPAHYDEAIESLEQAVEIDPRSFEAHKALYACYEQTGRHQQAVSHLREAKKINPNDKFVQQFASLLEEEENPRAGIRRREELRTENPADAANLLRLAELYERPEVNDLALARQRLLEALDADPTSTEAAQFGVRFFANQGDREAGEAFLRRHLEAQQGRGEILARVLLGRFYALLGDEDAALGSFRQARERVDQVFADGTEEERRNATVLVMSEMGRFFREAQRYEEMIDAYRVVLSHVASDDLVSIRNARRNLIHALLALREYGDAEKEINAYQQDFPADVQGKLAQAELLMARYELEKARDTLSQVLERDPDNAWALYMRGRIAIQLNRYSEARTDLLHAKSVAPDAFNWQHRLDLARLYELTDQPQLAEAELRELLPKDRGDDHDVELRLIRLLQNWGQFQRAQEFVNELRAREPQEPTWPYQLGRLLVAQGELAAAATALGEAAELTQYRNTDVVAELMSALVRGGRANEAASVYDKVDLRSNTPMIQTYAAEAYLAQNERDVAVRLLAQAVNAGSLGDVRTLWQVAGRSAQLLGTNDTVALLRRVLETAVNPAAALALRSTLARTLAYDEDPARRAEGLKMIDDVIAATEAKDPLHQEALLVRAMVQDQTGQSAQAVQTYEEILQAAPNNAQALNNLAYLLADKLDRAAEALPYAEHLLEAAPEQSRPVFLDTVGWVYFKAGKIAEAESALLDALRIAPDYLVARYHLGMIYLQRGNRAGAERSFRGVLEQAREQIDDEYVGKAEEALDQLNR